MKDKPRIEGPERCWKYLGTETHYDYDYHLWENAATKRKYAWEVDSYRLALTKQEAGER